MTVAVVTGAASGMGRECVESLRTLGGVLVAVDLEAPAIDGTVGVACDVSDPAAVLALAAACVSSGRSTRWCTRQVSRRRWPTPGACSKSTSSVRS